MLASCCYLVCVDVSVVCLVGWLIACACLVVCLFVCDVLVFGVWRNVCWWLLVVVGLLVVVVGCCCGCRRCDYWLCFVVVDCR